VVVWLASLAGVAAVVPSHAAIVSVVWPNKSYSVSDWIPRGSVTTDGKPSAPYAVVVTSVASLEAGTVDGGA